MRINILIPISVILFSCDPNDPANPVEEYFLEYTDAGKSELHRGADQILEVLRNDEWETMGMDFSHFKDGYFVELKFQVGLPRDSSNVDIIPLGIKMNAGFRHRPGVGYAGALKYYRISEPGGTDVSVIDQDTLEYYSQINSITYLGRHYEPYETRIVCDYEVSGEFKTLITNDITGKDRILDDGRYRIKVSLLPQ